MLVISAALNLNNSSTDKQMSNRHPKFYGPLLGAFLANLLALPITARFTPTGSLKLAYNQPPNYWNRYENYYSHEDFKPSNWQPSSYDNSQYYPVLTTSAPQIHHHHHHLDKPLASQQQIVNIHDPSNEVVIEDSYPEVPVQSTIPPTSFPDLQEPIPAESSLSVRRQKVPKEFRQNSKRRTTTTYRPKQKRGTQRYYPNKKKYNNNKRRKTTTTEDYYESYEEYTTQKPKRKSQPKRPVSSYEDSASEYDYDYEESYEYTTRRPYKKRRRTTTRRNRYKNKNKKRQELDDYDEYDYGFNYRNPFDNINIRPRQETTTETTTTTTAASSSSSSTTTQTTHIMNGTTVAPNNATSNTTGYGYGPSNGNEGISITYGPPTGQNGAAYGPPRPSYGPPNYPQYHAHYSDWYESEATRNDIVQKVHDLIGVHHIF
ncbi:uncharacterized protein LOC126264325 [Aethina tumida]|uniref:uncharacterized protein LOC126264325 n=1 Tax=Aethina tumida TaxID=116153 RepID=UPI0021493E52|nr:uncharacterized protein LOC126264325 [Aethina tumida]